MSNSKFFSNISNANINVKSFNQTFDKLNKLSDKLNVLNVNILNNKRQISIKIIVQNLNFYIKKFQKLMISYIR